MKYIITLQHRLPIIFSEGDVHSEVARGVGGASSAGFCSLTPTPTGIAVRVYGESVSLKMKCGADDARLIGLMLNRQS